MSIESLLLDPVKFLKVGWPNAILYDKQAELLYSLRDNDETLCPAGNMLGKDWTGGYAALWYFLANEEVRVVTTSVKDDHLRVLWGELLRFIQTCKLPLTVDKGGPLVVNHRDIRKKKRNGEMDKISYLLGMVSEKGEGMAGHHARHTLCIGDECSGIDNLTYTQAMTWAKKFLGIGNCNPCNNFFFQGVEGGDILSENGKYYYRKIIRIKAEDSPNVQLALKQIARGLEPTLEEIVPNVIGYQLYRKRRTLWDKVRQCVGLDAEFWKGTESLLYPPDWLNECEAYASELKQSGTIRKAKGMGVDSAEGGDATVWTIGDELGLIKLISMQTHDTTVIVNMTIALIREYKIPPENVVFDRGGGGKQHADQLRERGYDVRTVGFGESATPLVEEILSKAHTYLPRDEKIDDVETKYVYLNKRAEMYGELSRHLDPSLNQRFAIPAEYTELRRQLAPMPKLWDKEGRMYLYPKDKPNPTYKGETIKGLIGCSPDEADSLVLMFHGMTNKPKVVTIGAMR